jgi:hypothetical protein
VAHDGVRRIAGDQLLPERAALGRLEPVEHAPGHDLRDRLHVEVTGIEIFALPVQDPDRGLVADLLLDDRIEELADFHGQLGALVEFSPAPHAMGDHVGAPIDREALRIERVGVHHEHGAVLLRRLADLREDVAAHHRQVPVAREAALVERLDAGGAGFLHARHAAAGV